MKKRVTPAALSAAGLGLLLTLGAVLLMRVEMSPDMLSVANLQQLPVALVLPSQSPHSSETRGAAAELTDWIKIHYPQAEVANVTTVEYPVLDGDVLAFVPPSAGTVAASPLLQQGVLTADGSSLVSYVRGVGDEAADLVGQARQRFPQLRAGGGPYWNARAQQAMGPEILRISMLAIIVLIVVFYRVAGSHALAWVYLSAAFTSLVWGFALFGLFGVQVNIVGLAIPVLAMGFSTSYVLHLGSTPSELKKHAVVVVMTAGTTAAGLAGLAVQPMAQVRELGLLGMAAVLVAVVCAFVSLPLQLAAGRGWQPGVDGAARLRGSAESRAGRWAGGRQLSLRTRTLLLTLLALLTVPGVMMAEVRFSWSDSFWGFTRDGRDASYMNQQVPGFQDIYLDVQLPGEYPWVDMERYHLLKNTLSELERTHAGVELIGPDAVIEEFLAVYSGDGGGDGVRRQEPQNEMELGESFALLAGREGLQFRVIDPSFARVQIAARSIGGWQDPLAFTEHAERLFRQRFDGAEVQFAGLPMTIASYDRTFFPSQLRAILVFSAIALLICLIWLRSLRQAAAVLLPPACAIAGVVALTGYLNWPLSIFDGAAFSLIAGIGVDDAILVRVLPDSRVTRRTVVHTTLILAALFSMLMVSSYMRTFRLGFMVVVGLALSTTVVLLTHTFANGEEV